MNLLPVLLNLLALTCGEDDWPAFRGDGSGTSAARTLPVHWSPDSGIAWKAEIPGYGQSSPVVWAGRVFLTSIDGANMERCFVHAFDLAAGERLWTSEIAASQPVENYFRNSRAAPTCVVDENYVFAFFAGGDVLCLTHDGETVWRRSLVETYGKFDSERGVGSSLAQTDEAVVVLVDHEGPSYLVALKKESGEELWKADRGVRGSAWTSPLVTQHGGEPLVIVSSAGTVEAHHGRTGERLWALDGFVGNRIPSAGVAGDYVFVGATQSVHKPGETQAVGKSNQCLRLMETDGRPDVQTVWAARRADPHYATPLAYEDHVYYVSSAGVLRCLDQATGEIVYSERVGGASWCSPIGAAGHVYLFLKDGAVLVLEPGPVFSVVASNRLWSEAEEAPGEGAPPPRFTPPIARPGAGDDPGEGEGIDFEKQLRSMDLATQQRIFSFFDPVIYGAAAVEGHLLVRTGHELFCVRSE